jgi:hypothetical protein
MLSNGTCLKNDNVEEFFEILEKALQTHNFTADRVSNFHETGPKIAADVVCSHNHDSVGVGDFG